MEQLALLYKKYQKYTLGVLVIGVVLLGFTFYSSRSDGKLYVTFFNVGQGDSVLIKTPLGQKVLIDGGPDDKVLGELGKSLPFYDRTIDIVILSHPHADHLTGLVEVFKRYKIKLLVLTGIDYNTPEYSDFLEVSKNKNIPIKLALASQSFDFGESLKLELIYPEESLVGEKAEDLNDTSIVSKLIFNQISFLFTGDLEEDKQSELNKDLLDVDILKVPHHGSKSSLAADFLKFTTPEVSIISVGQNKFGHPSESILERLKNFGSKIWRTNEGAIKIVSDGDNFWRK